jgi:hypothetical protein|tara:strand:+ start:1054 stop:1233 length:180 start_codon:yes stop_codon:yes gene_type:complete
MSEVIQEGVIRTRPNVVDEQGVLSTIRRMLYEVEEIGRSPKSAIDRIEYTIHLYRNPIS